MSIGELRFDGALVIVIAQNHIPRDLKRGRAVDPFIAFLPVGIVQAGYAVIKLSPVVTMNRLFSRSATQAIPFATAAWTGVPLRPQSPMIRKFTITNTDPLPPSLAGF